MLHDYCRLVCVCVCTSAGAGVPWTASLSFFFLWRTAPWSRKSHFFPRDSIAVRPPPFFFGSQEKSRHFLRRPRQCSFFFGSQETSCCFFGVGGSVLFFFLVERFPNTFFFLLLFSFLIQGRLSWSGRFLFPPRSTVLPSSSALFVSSLLPAQCVQKKRRVHTKDRFRLFFSSFTLYAHPKEKKKKETKRRKEKKRGQGVHPASRFDALDEARLLFYFLLRDAVAALSALALWGPVISDRPEI